MLPTLQRRSRRFCQNSATLAAPGSRQERPTIWIGFAAPRMAASYSFDWTKALGSAAPVRRPKSGPYLADRPIERNHKRHTASFLSPRLSAPSHATTLARRAPPTRRRGGAHPERAKVEAERPQLLRTLYQIGRGGVVSSTSLWYR